MAVDAGLVISNLWIIILLLIVLIPMAQRYAIASARKRLLVRFGKSRGSHVITLIHRQEVISFLGIPLARYIDIDDSEQVLRAIRTTPADTPLDLVLHTPGGLALAATQIALALQAHRGKTTVIIPHYAMSGGTLIALAADEIVMDPYAALGPVDPQVADPSGVYPVASLLRVLETKTVDRIDDRTLVLADEGKKALRQLNALVRRLVEGKYPDEIREKILDELASGKYSHDHPFMADDAATLLGSRVTTAVPQDVYDLMAFYRMDIGRWRPGVEYVPAVPRE